MESRSERHAGPGARERPASRAQFRPFSPMRQRHRARPRRRPPVRVHPSIHPSIERPSLQERHALQALHLQSVRRPSTPSLLATGHCSARARQRGPARSRRAPGVLAVLPVPSRPHRARRHREIETWRRGRRLYRNWLRGGAARQWLVPTGHAPLSQSQSHLALGKGTLSH
jgi:hypothetical protein